MYCADFRYEYRVLCVYMSRHTCGVLFSFKIETAYVHRCFQSPNPQKGTQKKIIELPLQLPED